MTIMFRDRQDAGRRLADALQHLRAKDPVVLALPRGGVPVAFEVAARLGAPLDLILVRKIGAPFNRELAVGAVADGKHPEIAVNPYFTQAGLLPAGFVEQETELRLGEIERRRERYLGKRARVPLGGRIAIVVDDGIATGATMRAALRAVRQSRPERLVLAVPVASRDSLEELRAEVDEAICLETPEPFGAIGCFYKDFDQVDDEAVIGLLDQAAALTAIRSAIRPTSRRS
jgi:predicted phosphoribosyltransferase